MTTAGGRSRSSRELSLLLLIDRGDERPAVKVATLIPQRRQSVIVGQVAPVLHRQLRARRVISPFLHYRRHIFFHVGGSLFRRDLADPDAVALETHDVRNLSPFRNTETLVRIGDFEHELVGTWPPWSVLGKRFALEGRMTIRSCAERHGSFLLLLARCPLNEGPGRFFFL